MDDNTLDDAASPEAGRPRRTPPTIDLKASEVSSSTEDAGDKNEDQRSTRSSSAAFHPLLVAAATQNG